MRAKMPDTPCWIVKGMRGIGGVESYAPTHRILARGRAWSASGATNGACPDSAILLSVVFPIAHSMLKKIKLEAAVLRSRADWRKVCAKEGTSAEDRRMAFAAWKKAERALVKARLALENMATERRKAAADRRKAHNPEQLSVKADRRKTARRP